MPPPKPTIRHILYIDDDEEDYSIFEEALQFIHADILLSYTNDLASQLNKFINQSPDLVFLDINMPLHDGFYWLQLIRSTGLRMLPVVMYSTTKNEAQMRKAYEEGAHLFFTKPYSFTELTTSLERILQLNWKEPEYVKSNYFLNGIHNPF